AADVCAAMAASNNYASGLSSTLAIVTGSDVLSCYNSFTIDSTTRQNQITYLKQYFNLYPYLDIAKSSSSPLFSSNVDLFATLDAIASNSSITTEYDFQTQVQAAITSLNDAHSSYYPSCFLSARLMQPFIIDAKFTTGSAPTIYIRDSFVNGSNFLGGSTTSGATQFKAALNSAWSTATNGDPSTYAGYTVSKINGMDAVAYIQKVADYWSGISHSPETRFNYYMPSTQWSSSASAFNFVDGTLYRIVSIPYNMDWYWNYELTSPTGTTVTLSQVPWAGYVMATNTFADAATYYSNNCQSSSTTSGSASKLSAGNKLLSGSASAIFEENGLKFRTKPTTSHNGITLDADVALATHNKHLTAATLRLDAETKVAATFSLSNPLVGDGMSAFYMLDDGVTGIMVLGAFEPATTTDAAISAAIGTITSGLTALESAGASKLIIDLTENGGGVICIGAFLLNYLMNQPVTPLYDVRLSTEFASLMTYADSPAIKDTVSLISESGMLPIGGGSIMDSTYTYTRGGVTATYSDKFYLNCTAFSAMSSSLPTLSKGWSPNAIFLLSDGFCGSTCAEFTRMMRDEYGVKTMVTGGSTGAVFQPSSFEGGSVGSFSDVTSEAQEVYTYSTVTTSEAATWPMNSLPLPVQGTLPLWESYSPQGTGGLDNPVEWMPEPAEILLDVSDTLDKAAVWAAAAKAAGSPTNSGKSAGTTQTSASAAAGTGTGTAGATTTATGAGGTHNGVAASTVGSAVVQAAAAAVVVAAALVAL
ncbi:hypothetical protein HK405_012103, partial [Cladochytrium tenue]